MPELNVKPGDPIKIHRSADALNSLEAHSGAASDDSAHGADNNTNLAALYRELAWLEQVINQVIVSYLKQDGHEQHWHEIPVPDLTADSSIYADQVRRWQLDQFERLALALVLAPHLKPEALDIFFGRNQMIDRPFSEFGGSSSQLMGGFIPTGQTLAFLMSANNPLWRTQVYRILAAEHLFALEQVIFSIAAEGAQAQLNASLHLSNSWVHYFLTGEQLRPELSPAFPAMAITTPLGWSDLVLDDGVMAQVSEVRAWLTHGRELMHGWGLSEKIKPGYRCVFYGPPGTGKSLTAALLGKACGRAVYRVDLSMLVSKYIGETEKNLGKLFDVASHKDWILFFDEAESLFAKRTGAASSNDRFANQQTGYLLQRIEDYPGTVILATNLKTNMDEAFLRRFQNMVQFTMPGPDERLMLWQNAFAGVCALAPDVSLPKIAEQYEMAGGAIINVLRYCCLCAISRGEQVVYLADIIQGIRKELRKENKTLILA